MPLKRLLAALQAPAVTRPLRDDELLRAGNPTVKAKCPKTARPSPARPRENARQEWHRDKPVLEVFFSSGRLRLDRSLEMLKFHWEWKDSIRYCLPAKCFAVT